MVQIAQILFTVFRTVITWVFRGFFSGITKIITKLKGWFLSILIGISEISTYLLISGAGGVVKGIVITPIFAINFFVITIWTSLIASLFALILLIYNQIQKLLIMLNGNIAGSGSSHPLDPSNPDILSLSFQIFKASGMWDGIVDVFNLFASSFLFLLWVALARHTLSVLAMYRKYLMQFLDMGSLGRVTHQPSMKMGGKKFPPLPPPNSPF